MNQVLEDSLGGVSYLHRVSNRMQLATSCITFWCQLFSNGLRCWYKSEVQTRARWQTWCILYLLRYCAKETKICGLVMMRPSLGSPCCWGLLQGTVLGMVRVLCWCRNTLSSSLARSHVSSFFFPFLCWQNILQAHMTFFSASCCWLSHLGCRRGNHKEKHALFWELRGPKLKTHLEHRLSDC